MTIEHPIWVAIIGTLAVARLARLIVFDQYPPTLWLKTRYLVLVGDSRWGELVKCAFCLAPWIALGDMAWAYFTDFHWSWWAFNIWLAVGYVAAMVVAYDQPAED